MWKFTLFSVAVFLNAALGKQISASLLREIASMMRDDSNTGSCGSGTCCVEVDDGEMRLLHLGESISAKDPCLTYTCTGSGLSEVMITCQPRMCTDGTPPVPLPGTCCPVCRNSGLEEGGCDFTDWSGFGPCSVTCGMGKQARVRGINNIASDADFVNCTGKLTEVKNCDAGLCIEHCEWDTREVGECVPHCGGGEKRRYYIITQHPANGGQDCPPFVYANKTELVECCENCTWEYQFGECSKSCGGGERVRYPVVTTPAKAGGFCPELVRNNKTEEEECNPQPCPCDFEECELQGKRRCIDPNDDPDKDCVPSSEDNCRTIYNPDQSDVDDDDIGDVCDKCNMTGPEGIRDRDSDTVDDICDNCPQDSNEDQRNDDNDETGNACDIDDDNDRIIDTKDNCHYVPNSDQSDRDDDTVGDLCDNCPDDSNTNQADKDGDGWGNVCDNCRLVPNKDQTDSDGDGVGDACESSAQEAYLAEEGRKMSAEDERHLLVKIMEKMLEIYYSN